MIELNGQRWDFYLDASFTRQVFEKHKAELSDLKPAFWESLRKLEQAADQSDWQDLRLAFSEARKQLGSPGDFGYGTPCGDALRTLYDSWNKLCEEMKASEPATTAV